MKKLLCVVAATLCLTGCTQQVTKNFGGEMTIELDEGKTLEEITWKDNDLWILTRDRTEDEQVKTHEFYSKKDIGFEGKITIVEK